MKDLALKNRILRFMRMNPVYINGGEIERLALAKGYKASNASRRLRELHEDGLIERETRAGLNGTQSVWYRYKQSSHEVMSYQMKLLVN